MGQLESEQNSLFYDFCLEKHIPKNHLLRRINKLLNFKEIRNHLDSFYSHTGRPSIDPELMIRMLLVGYCYGIRSERRLCDEVNYNLAYRWFCQLGLEDKVPNHSTFSKNRHGRYRDSDLFRFVFNQVVKKCFDNGLVKGEGFAVDASLICADASRMKSIPGTDVIDALDRETATRAVKEYFKALDDEALPNTTFKKVSPTDPMSAYMRSRRGTVGYYYSTNYLIDIDNNIIVDVEATPSHNASEVSSTKTMINRVEEKYGMTPKSLMGDTAYGTAEMLNWTVEKGIIPYSPVFDRTERNDGTYSSSEFIFDRKNNEYICPNNKRLHTTNKVTKDNTRLYRSRIPECVDCADKTKCCPNTSTRKIARSIYEDARDIARAVNKTVEFQQAKKDRKKVEVLFGHLKRILRFDQLRLRGLNGASDEFLLAATAQNLRRMAKIFSQPPPLTG